MKGRNYKPSLNKEIKRGLNAIVSLKLFLILDCVTNISAKDSLKTLESQKKR
jgi:hypothetical protein